MPRELTEEEWLNCSHPKVLLYYAPELSQRKLRLFSIACVHQVWDRLSSSGQKLVQKAEEYADGTITREELYRPYRDHQLRDFFRYSTLATIRAVESTTLLAGAPHELSQHGLTIWEQVAFAQNQHGWESYDLSDRVIAKLFGQQCEMLRDIIGNPYRPVELQPQWLSRDQGTVVKMAQVIYDKRAYEDLPFLGDALEEAGCTDDTILEHCRQEQSHCHGCWALDLILGRF